MTSAARPRGLVRVADYPPGARFGPRTLRDHEFVWVLAGSARWRLTGPDGRLRHEQLLRPGTLALAPAGLVDTYDWDAAHPSRHAYVHLEAEEPTGADRPLTRDLADHPVLAGLCDYLLDLGRLGGPAARGRSDQLVALMLDVFTDGPFPEPAEATLPTLVRAGLDHARERWRVRGAGLVGVPALAGAAGVSPAHFSRVFAAASGCGPARALELVRLARAALALERSNRSIAEVAALAGFSNAYHFSARFRAAYGLPPGRFRATSGLDPLGPLADAGLLGVWHHMTRAE